ncbi:hypothetical protein D3C78_1652340 [compost metagenome]
MFRLLMQPVALCGAECRVPPALVLPCAVAQVVLQKLTIASIKAAVDQRFILADALFQLRCQIGALPQSLL